MSNRNLLARLSAIGRTHNPPTSFLMHVPRIRLLAWVIGGVIASLAVISAPAQAAGFPIIVSATVDYSHNTLTIRGENFGGSPTVTLDSMTFPTMGSASNQIVADFPNSSPPSSFAPGTYFLTLRFKNQFPTIFTVDIGAIGPQGAQGVAGPAGPPGPQGTQGLTALRVQTVRWGLPDRLAPRERPARWVRRVQTGRLARPELRAHKVRKVRREPRDLGVWPVSTERMALEFQPVRRHPRI
jgi:hypothetical protein